MGFNNRAITFIIRNFGWMIVSLVLAVLIWVAANLERNPVEQNQLAGIPVHVELPEGFVITDRPDIQTVTAVIRAAASEWNLLVPSDVLVTADLSTIDEPGEYRVPLEAEIPSPLRGEVVALRPRTWTLTVDREVEQRMAIQVVVTEDPPPGYTYPQDLTCDETEVLLRGSAERVAAVARVEARLNLSDELNPTTKIINLTPVLTTGLRARDVELIPSSVRCPVDIQARADVFQMNVQPRLTGSPPPGYEVKRYGQIEPSTVLLSGDLAVIRSLPGLVRTVPIDLTSHTETFTVEVPLDLPDGVMLVPENQLISVTVVIEPQVSTRAYEDVPVEVVGLDQTLYRAVGLADTVTVFVSAPPNLMPSRDEVRAVVDLSGLEPGNHTVLPQAVIMGAGDQTAVTADISPNELSVTIESLNPTPSPQATITPLPTRTPSALPIPPGG